MTRMGDPALRVLSCGAGVQSSTVLLMAVEGELPPIDVAIFADTGLEPPDVYAWLDVLRERAEHAGIEFIVTRRYDDERTLLSRPWDMPLFIRSGDDRRGMLRRQCTGHWKVVPIHRAIRRALADRGLRPQAGIVEQWFGISWDETQRMRASDVAYITNAYPLVDRRITRGDCQAWLAERGLTAPVGLYHLPVPFRPRMVAHQVATRRVGASRRGRRGAP